VAVTDIWRVSCYADGYIGIRDREEGCTAVWEECECLRGTIRGMNVFELDRAMIEEYAAFSRSFTKIRAADIREQIDSTYARMDIPRR
jgi:hypothetical protein